MEPTAYSRLTRVPEQSFFLFGVRGVGKSTWAGAALAQATRFDLLDQSLFQELLLNPARFVDEVRPLPPGTWVIIDEVQRLPGLLNEVHRLIEERRLRFALLGSSARKLKTHATNLLAGRALRKAMHPLTPAELGDDFEQDTALRYGTIPLIWNAPDRRAALHSYVQLYLREEIRQEAVVRNLPGFLRFLPIAALFHGQVLNISGVARDAGVARTTVEGYLDILDDTLLTTRLPGFEPRLRVRERRHPKLYWVDAGLVRAVKGQLSPVTAEEKGALLEGFVLHLLRAHGEENDQFEELSYWSPHGTGIEVDFLLKRGGEFVAIEVKSGARYSNAELTGLRAIGELPGLVRRILVFGGQRAFRTADGIEVWPILRLARELAQNTLWP